MKTSKTKRIMTGAMAAAMSLSMAVTAFAADPPAATNTETTITAAYKEIPIAVTVPDVGTAQINPYGLPVECKKSDNSTVKISGQQITTAPMGISNEGEIDLDVSATVIGTTKGAFKFVASADAITGKGAEGDADYVAPSSLANGFVYLQAKATAAVTGTAANDIQDAIIDTCVGTWASTYDEDADIPVSTIAATATAKPLGTLKAGTFNAGAQSGYAAGSILAVRLAGVVTESPRTPWAAADGFTATVSYSFKPAPATTP